MNDLKIVFNDGTEHPVQLTYRDLYELERSGKWEKELDEFFKIRAAGFNTRRMELDAMKVLHIAYLCAEKDEEKQMDFFTFLDHMDVRSGIESMTLISDLWFKKK